MRSWPRGDFVCAVVPFAGRRVLQTGGARQVRAWSRVNNIRNGRQIVLLPTKQLISKQHRYTARRSSVQWPGHADMWASGTRHNVGKRKRKSPAIPEGFSSTTWLQGKWANYSPYGIGLNYSRVFVEIEAHAKERIPYRSPYRRNFVLYVFRRA